MNDATSPNTETKGQPDAVPAGNPEQNVANRYFSVEVVPPGSATPDADKDTKQYTYFRMGMPNDEAEGKLPPDPADPGTPGTAAKSPWKEGILLYTTGQYKLVAPTSSQMQAESFNVVADGSSLASATYTVAKPFGDGTLTAAVADAAVGPTTVAVTRQNALKASLGTSISAGFGDDQTVTYGTKGTFGSGLTMDAAHGIKVSLGSSWDIKLGSGRAGLIGAGKSDYVDRHDVFSRGSISLSSGAGVAAPLTDPWKDWMAKFELAMTVVTIVIPALLAPAMTITPTAYWGAVQTESKMKQELIGTIPAMGSVLGLFTVIQVGIFILAALAKTILAPAATAAAQADPNGANLLLDGDANQNTYLAKGARKIDFNTLQQIELKNGITPPGCPTITLSPTDITLRAGQSAITIGPQGVSINAPNGINCAAGGSTLSLTPAQASLAGLQVTVSPTNPAAVAATAAAAATAQAQAAAQTAAAVTAAAVHVANQTQAGLGALAATLKSK